MYRYIDCEQHLNKPQITQMTESTFPDKNDTFFFFFLTKQALPSLLEVLVTFWKIALCYNGIFHFTLTTHMYAIYRLSYIKLNLLNLIL